MIDRVKERVLVIGDVWSGLVSAYGDSVVMSFTEFSTKSDVVDPGRVLTEVSWEVEREMVNRIEFHNLTKEEF